MSVKKRTFRSLLAAGLALLIVFTGCRGGRGSGAPSPTATERRVPVITLSGAWGKSDSPEGSSAFVYMEITNNGTDDDELVSASPLFDLAERAELHETVAGRQAQGEASAPVEMRPTGAIKIPAGSTVKLEPGGPHIALVGLKRKLEVGSSYAIELRFAKSGAVSTNFEVRSG